MLLLLAALVASQGTDTTIQVKSGSRLELSSIDGDITVQTWSRSAVRVEATHDEDTRIDVDQGDRTLSVSARSRYGPSEVTWRLTVPADMALDLSSQSGTVRVAGTRGEVSVSTVEGDITVEGGAGFIALQTVDGSVSLSGSNGRLKVSSVDGTIDIRRATGDIKASAVDGAITLTDIESSEVDASSVDGAITFAGAIRPGGHYELSSHDGDVTVVAAAINADVSVSTFSGGFESDFPVTISGTQHRGQMHFTLGTGGARLEVESFDGKVTLRKGTGGKP